MERTSECSICPPSVERCVHFEGKWLILHKQTYSADSDYSWLVCYGWAEKPPRFNEPFKHSMADNHVIDLDTLPGQREKALARFEVLALQMLGRTDDSSTQ